MIIHSPIISGSLTFADGATVTYPEGGVYSGSFSGSYQGDTFTGGVFTGDGSGLTFGGTGIVSSSAQLAADFLDTLGDGVISGSSQVEFNDVNNNPFTQGASSVTTSKSIIPSSLTLDLGSEAYPFRDLYLSSASLYIDGQQVISSNTSELIITTDTNQSLKLVETGADTITLQAENGDITLTTTGTGNIELDAPIQIGAGNQILSSDGNAIQFGEDINVQGNITVTGTVDGRDIATDGSKLDGIESGATADQSAAEIKTAYESNSDTNAFTDSLLSKLNNIEDSATGDQTGAEIKSLYEGESNTNAFTDAEKSKLSGIEAGADVTDAANVLAALPAGVVSGSAQITITESQISDLGSYVATNSVQALNNGTALSLSTNTLTLTKADGTTDTVDLSSYLDEDARAIASGTLNGATGIVTFTRDDSTTFTLDLSDLLDDTNLVTSVAGKNGVVTLDTDDVTEATNLYYTDARVKTKLNADAVVSGSSQVSFNDISSNPFENGGSNDITASGHIVPSQTLTYDLGSEDLRWRDLYLSGSTIDLGGTLITRDTSGDINFLDSSTRGLKKVVVEELQIGTGTSARKVKVDNGKIKFFDNTDSEDTGSIQVSPLSIPGLGDPGTSGPTLSSRVATLEGTDIDITLTGAVTGTGTINNLGDVSIATTATSDPTLTIDGDASGTATFTNLGNATLTLTIADDSHNHTIANVDGLQTALNSKLNINGDNVISSSAQVTITESQISDLQSYVTTNSVQALNNGTALSLSTNTLTLTKGDGTTDTVDLSAYLDEDSRSIASGTLNSTTGIVTFTRDDSTTFTLDLSDLLDDTNLVTSVAGRTGVITLTTSDVSEGSNQYYTDGRVKAKMNADLVVSGSASAVRTFLNVENGATADQTKADIDALGIDAATVDGFTVGKSVPSNAVFTDTQLSTEEVQDIAGGMFTGNTESGIIVTYDDGSGKINLTVSSQTDNNFTNTLKSKLDGIAENANNYSLPTATSSVLGGVKIGSGISISSGVISADSQTDNNFTNALKTKLDGIAANANNYSHPTYTARSINTSGAQVLDILTTDTSGHVTAASVRTMTLANLGYNGDTNATVTSTANVKSALNASLGGSATIGDASDTITIPGNLTVTGTTTTNNVEVVSTSNGVVFEGNAADANEGTLLAGTLTADRTYTLPNKSGTVAMTSDIPTNNNQLTNGAGYITGYTETDTLQTVTSRGASTSTAISITNSTASTSKTTGALKVTGGVGISGALNVGGDVVAYASSDKRLKDNIQNIENPIGKVQQLNGVTWDWNDNADELQKSTPNVGVIAQEVEEVLPQLVNTRDNGYKAVDYAKLTGLLIEAIKDQQKQIDELKSRLQ